MGTTLVALKFDGGVVVGADTRTSASGYVSNKLAYKINPILTTTTTTESSCSTRCVLCRSGSAADTQHLAGMVQKRFLARQLLRPVYEPSVSQVAHLLRHLMRQNVNKDSAPQLQASLICAGYDGLAKEGQIFGIAPGGSLWEEDYFCVSGSGSTLLLGMLDAKVKAKMATKEENEPALFTKDEAEELVQELLQLSIARDGSSGGLIRIVVMSADGMEQKTVYPKPPNALDGGETKEETMKELKGFAPAKRQ